LYIYCMYLCVLSKILQIKRKICDSDSFRETGIYNFKHFNIFYIRNYTIFEHSDSPRKSFGQVFPNQNFESNLLSLIYLSYMTSSFLSPSLT
ncbi:hypothetical protein L9F63_004307, partial [Diploptera punctata]